MVQVMIRLQNHGLKNHQYWWIVVQPKNKCLKGRILERVGLWIPRRTHTVDRAVIFNKYKLRYWLSVGATPSNKVHHLLTMIDFLPKKPIPFGSEHKLERKPRTYKMEYFHNHRWHFHDKELQKSYFYGKIKQLEALMNRHIEFEKSAMNEMIQPEDIKLKHDKKQHQYDEEMNTDEINSDDGDFFNRKRNFDIISAKLDKYMKEKFHLYKGNDLKYNNYVRKIQKLSMKESLDVEGYKDYIESLKNLSDSNNKTLQNIAKIYLKDLMERENFNEIIKNVKFDQKFDLNSLDKDKLLSSSVKDTQLIIKNLNKSFESFADTIFNLNENQKEKLINDSNYKDLVNLRITKLMIKLRLQVDSLKLIVGSEDYLQAENLDLFPFINDETVNKLESRLRSIEEDLKKNPENLKNLKIENEYENNLFDNLNSFIVNTDTLKKYSNYLLNLDDNKYYLEIKNKNIIENIFSLNTDSIDKIMLLLIDKLSKSYELNEVFRDEVEDLAQFHKEEVFNIQKRLQMKKELYDLKMKFGDGINVLYDDYQGETQEISKAVREFKGKYKEEIESELDIKFKEVFKILLDKSQKTMHKYDDPVEFENDGKFIQKFDEIQNKVMEEIRQKQAGTFVEQEKEDKDIEETEKDEYTSLERDIRTILNDKFLNEVRLYDKYAPKVFDDGYKYLREIAIHLPKKAYKGHKIPNEDEIKAINRRLKRFFDVINYSKNESAMISNERIDLITDRFLENFGRYNETIYPDGFRHLESFEVYNSVYPLKNMSDYTGELRGVCDFQKFIEIVFGAINQIKKIIMLGFEFPELYRKLNYLPVYLNTKRPEFIVTLKEIFKRNLQLAEKKNTSFTIYEALDYVSSFKLIDSILPEITSKIENDDVKKLYDLVSTERYSTMRLHDFNTPRNKDMGLTRQGPFMPINPLKGHKANPYIDKPVLKFKKNTPYRMKSRGFCTKI